MKLLNLLKLKKLNSSGFTLIELLVVIGILGILASAMVATIDPFEQIKKGDDTNVKNTTVEFVNASIRYYTTHNAMPWTDTANAKVSSCTTLAGSMSTTTFSLTDAAATDCLGALIDDGELKGGFTSVSNILAKIKVSSGEGKDPVNSVVACFQPASKSQAKSPDCKYNAMGVETTGLTHDPSVTSTLCYWCAQ